jgi:hypothetical protein
VTTQAQNIADFLGNDGERDLNDAAGLLAEGVRSGIDGGVRWDFSDGSSIIQQNRTWDLGFVGASCHCWKGAGHTEDCARRTVEHIAEAHLHGIEGGLSGAVADVRGGAGIDTAAGLDGDEAWDLPEGVSLWVVKAEVRRLLREAVDQEEAQEADDDARHAEAEARYQAKVEADMTASNEDVSAE